MAAASTTAPGGLERIRAFVNTRDVDGQTDRLADVAGLLEWFRENDLLSPGAAGRATEADRRRALAVREAFRELLLANNDGHPGEPAVIDALNDAAGRAGVRLRLDGSGRVHLEASAPGVDGALGRLLLIAYEAMQHGDWPRLKACRNDTCQWAFYDRSKNRSRTWCSMDACGSQVKARSYRARRRARAAAGTDGP